MEESRALLSIETDGSFYTVRSGDRYEDKLGADEALYLIARVLVAGRKPENVLRTLAQHEEWERTMFPQPPELQPWQKLLEPRRQQ